MARKTTGNSTTTRRKKADATIQPTAMQVAPELEPKLGQEILKNGKSASHATGNLARNLAASNLGSSNLEEEIRRRAYELYLQRRAAAGSSNGDSNQDWLIAEHEIRSRQSSQEQHTA